MPKAVFNFISKMQTSKHGWHSFCCFVKSKILQVNRGGKKHNFLLLKLKDCNYMIFFTP